MFRWKLNLKLACSCPVDQVLQRRLVRRARRVARRLNAVRSFAGDESTFADVLGHLEDLEATIRRARASFPPPSIDDPEDHL